MYNTWEDSEAHDRLTKMTTISGTERRGQRWTGVEEDYIDGYIWLRKKTDRSLEKRRLVLLAETNIRNDCN